MKIEAWWRRGGKATPTNREAEEEAWKAYRFEPNAFDKYQQQEASGASLQENIKPQGGPESRRGSVTAGGNGHVAGGKVVKPSVTPRPLLGQIPATAGPAGYEVMGRELTQGGDGPNGVEKEATISRSAGTSSGPRPLLGHAGYEADGEGFDAGAWEEIGRQWARIRPWELR